MTQEHKHNSTPLFSIVIPTYNHGHLIGRCLDSVVGQSCGDWEAIVVNNFSQDDTIEVVESYGDPRIRLVNFANNGIIAASRNKGISEARGQWICFLDSDDWWTPDKLDACLPYLDKNDVVYHTLWIYLEHQGLTAKTLRAYAPRKPIFVNLLLHDSCMPNSSACIRRTVIEQAGQLSEERDLVAVEDYDYWLRLSRVTERFAMIPKVLGYYWIGTTSISSSPKWIARHDAIYSKYLPMVEDAHTRKRIEKRYNYSRGVICLQVKEFQEAKKTLRHALSRQNSILRNLKILCRLAVLTLKH